ncbi:hypothetical protein CC1G_13029 [Coprinopsis cinerea okayama7|uniref:Uncharacterized protein n=1 Tax=Coprinopsis cinerea (strain Okayama-7 / 130 / ATCC MYA-4618 / FGSC 9003) TaxID=240176 RepID=A8PGU9_COPC7|nr:hypothetical protein CC1G_13029 [Coprinopsis cinerea okayama7\|eukprot:XP_001841286.1 hypothetical protein CC1G_13029 [Coprinopsis cinerea okayama7\
MSPHTRSATRAQEASASQLGSGVKKEESEDESIHSQTLRGGRALLAKRKDDKRALSRLQKKLNKARVAKVNGKRKRNNLRDRLRHMTERLKEVDDNLRSLSEIVEAAKEVCDKAKGVIEDELNDVIIYRSDDSECVGSDDDLSERDE